MRAANPSIVRGLFLTALLAAGPALAQEEATAPPIEAEASPPPPEEDNQALVPQTIQTSESAPAGAFPPAPPQGTPRLVHAELSIGPGWLALRDKQGRDGQAAASLTARLGAVIAPEWSIFLGVDHSSTDRGEATFSQTAGLVGAQRYFFGRLYLGGAFALAMVRETGVPDGLTDGPGVGFSALLGVEAIRGNHVALTAEASFTLASYGAESWEMGGVRLGVALF